MVYMAFFKVLENIPNTIYLLNITERGIAINMKCFKNQLLLL